MNLVNIIILIVSMKICLVISRQKDTYYVAIAILCLQIVDVCQKAQVVVVALDFAMVAVGNIIVYQHDKNMKWLNAK